MKKGSLLFVYGTLRRGERADLSKHEGEFGAKHLGEDKINGTIYHLGGFPGVKAVSDKPFNPEEPVVVGDVFEVMDNSLVTMLDHYEGYPIMYDRMEVKTAAGRDVWVYTYNFEVEDDQIIKNGDWCNRPQMKIQ